MVTFFDCAVYGLLIGFFGYWLCALVGWSIYELISLLKNS